MLDGVKRSYLQPIPHRLSLFLASLYPLATISFTLRSMVATKGMAPFLVALFNTRYFNMMSLTSPK
jgi:hypothetical protein